MLCTSGFVNDVTFSHNGVNRAESKTMLFFLEFARWRHRRQSCCVPIPYSRYIVL